MLQQPAAIDPWPYAISKPAGLEMELDPRYLIATQTQYADHDVRTGWHAVNLELANHPTRSRSGQLLALRARLGKAGHIDAAHLATTLDCPASFMVATAVVTAAGLHVLEDLVRPMANEQDRILRRFEYAQSLKPPRIRPRLGLTLRPGIELAASSGRTPGAKGRRRGADRDVLAVIDYGCPFMHPLLCVQTGASRSTRVRALWDQQAGGPIDGGLKPSGFNYGTELSRAQLNAVIDAVAGDERVGYELLGYQAMRMRESHGAHSLGMLLDDGARPRGRTRRESQPDILFVQLPQALLSAPNRAVLSRHVVDALVWLESHRAPDERLILSLGEGSSQGPNDGSSIVERALQAFTRWGRRGINGIPSDGLDMNRIYIAAGNGFEEKLHAQTVLSRAKATSFLWRVPPGSELPATVEIWLPTDSDDLTAGVQVDLFAPGGQIVVSGMRGQTVHWPNPVEAVASVASTSWRGNGCTLCLIRLAPTAASHVRATVGDWTITLTAQTEMHQPVHLFIGRIKQALGFPLRTVQSTFVVSKRQGFVGPSSMGTIQGLATAEGVVRVGAIVGSRDRAPQARYSSDGPSRDGSIHGPDVFVTSDDGAVLRGRRSIGNRSSVSFRMNGTSVGAPTAARLDRGTSRPAPKAGLVAKPKSLRFPPIVKGELLRDRDDD